MNVIKKLRELGFTKIPFHKPNPYNDGEAMILDEHTTKHVIDNKTGRYIQVKEKKIHPKQDSHWKLVFNEQYIIWIMVRNNVVDKVYLQDNFNKIKKTTYEVSLRNDLTELYNFNGSFGTATKIVSKKQIINLLPLSIKRDFIIKDLFK